MRTDGVYRARPISGARGLAAELIRAVARAHWRAVKAALERDGLECCGVEERAEDLAEGERIGDGGD